MGSAGNIYETDLQKAYDQVVAGLDAGVTLSGITSEAILQSSRWNIPAQTKSWNWQKERDARVQRKQIFELAIWYRNKLQGLSLGEVFERDNLCLDLIAGNPDRAEFLGGKIFPITHDVLDAYARLIGVTEIRIYYPVNELVGYYCGHGYTYLGEMDYCVRTL